MKQTNQSVTSQNIKKGIIAIVIGLAIVVIGSTLISQSQAILMIAGWVLDIFGVLLGLSGFGYLVGLLGRKK